MASFRKGRAGPAARRLAGRTHRRRGPACSAYPLWEEACQIEVNVCRQPATSRDEAGRLPSRIGRFRRAARKFVILTSQLTDRVGRQSSHIASEVPDPETLRRTVLARAFFGPSRAAPYAGIGRFSGISARPCRRAGKASALGREKNLGGPRRRPAAREASRSGSGSRAGRRRTRGSGRRRSRWACRWPCAPCCPSAGGSTGSRRPARSRRSAGRWRTGRR